MGKSWREWGEERKERSLLKEHTNWKHEAAEELEEMSEHESAFIIVNEWVNEEGSGQSELVSVWHTENNAWMDLFEIAKEHGVLIDGEDMSFEVPDPSRLEADEYYIEERQFND